MRADLRAGVGALLAGMAVTVLPPEAASAPDGCSAGPARADEAAMTRLVAAHRRAAGAPKVRRTMPLLRPARAKSRAMASGSALEHSGSLPWAKGRAAGQNLAMAPTADEAFRAMLASPAHRANIRAREWRFAAVGAARACGGLVYFTLNFMGRPVR